MTLIQFARTILPETLLDTSLLRLFGVAKVPLIGFVRPRVLKVNPDGIQIMIPLSRRSQNHMRSMYMGALMIGADVAAAYYAAKFIYEKGHEIDFVFKTAAARFLKRPKGDVVFTCTQGAELELLVEEAQKTGQRVESQLRIIATVPSISEEIVAEMDMVLSLKKRIK